MAQILLAEPDRQIRDFIAGILTDFGHDVTACQNCTEAATLLTIGPFEVVVTDLVLRDDEGSTLSRHCVARGIPTITLTGHRISHPIGLSKTARYRLSTSPSGSTICSVLSTRWR